MAGKALNDVKDPKLITTNYFRVSVRDQKLTPEAEGVGKWWRGLRVAVEVSRDHMVVAAAFSDSEAPPNMAWRRRKGIHSMGTRPA